MMQSGQSVQRSINHVTQIDLSEVKILNLKFLAVETTHVHVEKQLPLRIATKCSAKS